MPKIRGDPAVEARKKDLRERYGGFMTVTDILHEFGIGSRTTAAKMLKGVPAYAPTGKKIYDVADIATLIEGSRL